jgi:hypothetical protein
MFNWLKKLFGSAADTTVAGLTYPPVTNKGQDEAALAPYKVEPPKAKPAPAVVKQKSAPVQKPATKKAPAKKPAGNTRGRKPKVSTVKK